MTNGNNKIKVAVYGAGALGLSAIAEMSLRKEDIELVAVFSKRADEVEPAVRNICKTYNFNQPIVDDYTKLADYADKVDVLLYCGDSAKEYRPAMRYLATIFKTLVDTYDDHSVFMEAKEEIDTIAKENENTVFMGYGWSPGVLSDTKIRYKALLPNCEIMIAYGPPPNGGGSRGHGSALRKIKGVADAVSITHYNEDVVQTFKNWVPGAPNTYQLHRRDNYIVLENGADPERITHDIENYESYFKGYQNDITFVSQEQLEEKRAQSEGHGGIIVARGKTASGKKIVLTETIDAESNTEATADFALGGVIAAYNMHKAGKTGAFVGAEATITSFSTKKVEEQLKGY